MLKLSTARTRVLIIIKVDAVHPAIFFLCGKENIGTVSFKIRGYSHHTFYPSFPDLTILLQDAFCITPAFEVPQTTHFICPVGEVWFSIRSTILVAQLGLPQC